MELKEFFIHKLVREGPLDSAFKAAPTVKTNPAAADPNALTGADLDGATQDVAPISSTSFKSFVETAEGTIGRLESARDFDSTPLIEFASALDDHAYTIYKQVMDPSAKIKLEAEYKKLAAAWSDDISSLFEGMASLKNQANKI